MTELEIYFTGMGITVLALGLLIVIPKSFLCALGIHKYTKWSEIQRSTQDDIPFQARHCVHCHIIKIRLV